MLLSPEITSKSHQLTKILRSKKLCVVSAESCTGGLFSVAMTEIPGASDVFERGFITYSNESKIELLTVPTFYIEDYGAVSLETAAAMAEGALLMSKADISIAITGIAGPDGGSDDKPVGTVFISSAIRSGKTSYEQHAFSGSRHSIRTKCVEAAFDLLIKKLGE